MKRVHSGDVRDGAQLGDELRAQLHKTGRWQPLEGEGRLATIARVQQIAARPRQGLGRTVFVAYRPGR